MENKKNENDQKKVDEFLENFLKNSAEKISDRENSENFLPEISVDQLILKTENLTENSESKNYLKKIFKI